MIPRKHHRVLVQGITGKQGTFWTEQMIACGTQIVGGVNPKKAGTEHAGVPVFASAKEAQEKVGFDIAVMFIPPQAAKAACQDACAAGAKLLVCLTEHIPVHDVLAMHHAARQSGTRIVGPNTAGIVTPGECFIGIMPGFNATVFRPGAVGVISRSGSLGTLICLNIAQAGMGQSVFYGVGGDPMLGTTTREALQFLDEDDATQAVAICGEIGGTAEEDAADYAKGMRKPVVAFLAGRRAPADKKMGHAGAIVSAGKGGYDAKRSVLEAAGVAVADTPSQIPELIRQRLG